MADVALRCHQPQTTHRLVKMTTEAVIRAAAENSGSAHPAIHRCSVSVRLMTRHQHSKRSR
jgi:hypothetical protein